MVIRCSNIITARIMLQINRNITCLPASFVVIYERCLFWFVANTQVRQDYQATPAMEYKSLNSRIVKLFFH